MLFEKHPLLNFYLKTKKAKNATLCILAFENIYLFSLILIADINPNQASTATTNLYNGENGYIEINFPQYKKHQISLQLQSRFTAYQNATFAPINA